MLLLKEIPPHTHQLVRPILAIHSCPVPSRLPRGTGRVFSKDHGIVPSLLSGHSHTGSTDDGDDVGRWSLGRNEPHVGDAVFHDLADGGSGGDAQARIGSEFINNFLRPCFPSAPAPIMIIISTS